MGENSFSGNFKVGSGYLKSRGNSLMGRVLLVLVIGIVLLSAILVMIVKGMVFNLLEEYAGNIVYDASRQLNAIMEKERADLVWEVEQRLDAEQLTAVINAGDEEAAVEYLENMKANSGVEMILVLDSNADKITSTRDYFMWTGNDVFYKTDAFQSVTENVTSEIFLFDSKVCRVALRKIGNDNAGNKMVVMYIETISSHESLDYYSLVTGADVTLFLYSTRIATSIIDENNMRHTGASIEDKDLMDAVYNKNTTYKTSAIVAGQHYISVFTPVNILNSKLKAMFEIGINNENIYRIIDQIVRGLTISILVLISLFGMVIIWFFMGVVLKPLRGAAQAIHALADDSAEADLTYRIPVKGDNEISHLSSDINSFLDKQQDLVIDLISNQSSLREIGSHMKDSAEESASAITEISANIDSVRRQAESQVKSLQGTSEEMNKSHELELAFDAKIELQNASILDSSSAIEEMLENIASVSNSIHKLVESFDELSEVTKSGEQRQSRVDQEVTAMSEQSKLLVEANSVISRIASQTNLLAMNAAIEAAHAGDAGAGFSVVADEIRSLAETSAKQTRIINKQLQEIATTIDEVVSASQLSKQSFGTIIERLALTGSVMTEIDNAMGQQDAASKQVLKALRDMNDSSSEVAIMSKNLRKSNERVMEEMRSLEDIVQAVSVSMEEMSSGAQQIEKSATDVSDMAKDTDDNIETMSSLVKRFKV